MILLSYAQGSPEWLGARTGVITASRFRDACERLKSGQPSKACTAYAAEIAVERVSGEPAGDVFQTWQMRRGTELEPSARLAYETETGNVVEEAGIALTEDRRFGYSTDGFIGADGGVEIKCPSSPEKLITLWRDRDLSEYLHQIQGGLWLTGRKWCDFVLYAPQLDSVGKSLMVVRVERDEEFIERLEDELLAFMRMVDDNERVLRQWSRVFDQPVAAEAAQ